MKKEVEVPIVELEQPNFEFEEVKFSKEIPEIKPEGIKELHIKVKDSNWDAFIPDKETNFVLHLKNFDRIVVSGKFNAEFREDKEVVLIPEEPDEVFKCNKVKTTFSCKTVKKWEL